MHHSRQLADAQAAAPPFIVLGDEKKMERKIQYGLKMRKHGA